MAVFIQHTNCERCGSSDANALYDNGSSYCFSCGSVGGADRPSFIQEQADEPSFSLPSDLSHDFPPHVLKWIAPTEITIEELIKNGYFYSKFTQGLYRLVGNSSPKGVVSNVASRRNESRCNSAEARFSFSSIRKSSTSPKSRFFGSKEETDGYVWRPPTEGVQLSSSYGNGGGSGQEDNAKAEERSLCITEDSLSAIKCARFVDAVPLFGSSISNNKLARIVKNYDNIFVWLDSDKLNSARNIADRIKMLGKKSSVIFTDLDPKYLKGNPYDFL